MITETVNLSDNKEVTLTCYCHSESSEMPTLKTRPTVLIFPGGAYQFCSDREADPIALSFLAQGYNAFILRYSLNEFAVFPYPVTDASVAMKYIRDNSVRFGVNPEKIAVCGFSAGGHLAATLGTIWNNETVKRSSDCMNGENKPNALILCYPVITHSWFNEDDKADFFKFADGASSEENLSLLTCDLQVGQHTPPSFILHTTEDSVVPSMDSLKFAQAMDIAKRPYELHIFQKGDHGLSLGNSTTDGGKGYEINENYSIWFKLCINWLSSVFQ